MYEHIVSLGWYCGTASAMSENGFRETSGPFDWMFSDLSAVLFYLDKHFVGFLDENQLEVISEKKFRNKKEQGENYTLYIEKYNFIFYLPIPLYKPDHTEP